MLERVAMLSSSGSSWPRDWTHVSYLLHWQAGSLLVPPRKPLSSTMQTYRTEREDTRIFGPGCASSIASWPSASKLQLILEQNYANHKSSSQVALVVENQCRRHKRPRFNPWIGNPLQYSYLENPMDRGKPQAAIHRVAKSRTRSDLSHMHGASYLNWLFFEADHPMNLLNLFWLINEISCLENPMDRGA